jgi:hypothetical protein
MQHWEVWFAGSEEFEEQQRPNKTSSNLHPDLQAYEFPVNG